MRTLGRMLIILLAITIVMGVMYVAVNSVPTNAPAQSPRPDRGDRPKPPDRDRGERSEGGGFRLVLSALKNTVVIAIIVALVVVPKGWLRRRKRQAQINGA